MPLFLWKREASHNWWLFFVKEKEKPVRNGHYINCHQTEALLFSNHQVHLAITHNLINSETRNKTSHGVLNSFRVDRMIDRHHSSMSSASGWETLTSTLILAVSGGAWSREAGALTKSMLFSSSVIAARRSIAILPLNLQKTIDYAISDEKNDNGRNWPHCVVFSLPCDSDFVNLLYSL